VLVAVCAPFAMALLLLLMERLEATMFPVRNRDAGQPEQRPVDVVDPLDHAAGLREAA
jgi:hypothetical protein